MKVKNLFQISLMVSLFLGALTFWSASAPGDTDTDSIIGGLCGRWFLTGNEPCDGAMEMSCQDGPPGTQSMCSEYNLTWVCIEVDESDFKCTPMGFDQCDTIFMGCPGEETGCE